ncbi:MAG: glutamate dehydrogenase [Candidatus Endobugula sp.]|jgi:glutamate dehydrogenase
MDMSLIVTGEKSAFTTQLSDAIKAKCSVKEADKLVPFSIIFFEYYPIEELAEHDINDVIGLLKDSYQFISLYKQKRAKVRAFNPDIKDNGWGCKNTVVTVHYNNVPFMIDSVRMALTNKGILIKKINPLILSAHRDREGELIQCEVPDNDNQSPGPAQELYIYIEIDRHNKTQDLQAIAASIRKTIADVNIVNGDYSNTIDEMQILRDTIGYSKSHHTREEIYEANQFIAWLMVNNFTFLGYAFYRFTGIQAIETQAAGLSAVAELEKSYGLLNKEEEINNYFPVNHDKLSDPDGPLLTFSKSPIRSTIHRQAYPDHITIQAYDADGNFVGVHHIVGLYTSQVYRATVVNIPFVRKKVESIYAEAGLSERSYNGKVLRQILETFPRDELFQSSHDELKKTLLGVATLNERNIVRLFMRESVDKRFVTAMIYIPRDQFYSQLREKITAYISDAVGSESEEFYTCYSESILSRTYVVFRLNESKEKQWDEKILEATVQHLSKSWEESLAKSIRSKYSEDSSRLLIEKYKYSFSNAYQESFSVDTAMQNIETIEDLNEKNPIALCFSQPDKNDNKIVHFKVFNYGAAMPLSDVIPVLERMNLKVIGEHPYKIKMEGSTVWLHDLLLHTRLSDDADISEIRQEFESAFINVWRRKVDNDFFNGLVISANINWRDVSMLRTYAAYMKQIVSPFSKRAITRSLMSYPHIAQQLVDLFYQRFDPSKDSKSRNKNCHTINKQLEDDFESVSNLNDDRILRQYLALINATMRTNYFQKTEGEYKDCISVKLNPKDIPNVPEPRPVYEIFVYSNRVEGVHLRGGKVARGGLRWSDRMEDFRTEVLGLVKAQNVKNAVIVPNGAKGGFIAKKANMDKGREAFQEEGIAAYKTFIRGLLDVTDNLEKGKVIAPENVVRWDEDDPYLVVAADKGTATFSDIANEVAIEYGHWLGDAFASGGSAGYDHKAMGITAKGAWVSVQRHFKEKGINVQEQDFTVIGIGDMGGDVFGNGMLMSPHICLAAAFNHLHIFVDPSPKASSSYEERKRLFTTPGSNWADYNQKLLSRGGGVFSRDAKSITLTPEIQQCFDIAADRLTPTELIYNLLKAPVDLIWNGGIGTYVKSAQESHLDIGDKGSDALRVNGSQLRCKVFGEGGNLGMSQRGRIEYCLHGGACNTDFIDNAAGVDCSDHEVNIKILLSEVMLNGGLTNAQRNRLLSSTTNTISDMVLTNNYYQTQSISLAQRESLFRLEEYRRLITALEASGRLDRELEFIPSDQELLDRRADNYALTRPELAVLNCYVKVELKELLATDEIANNTYLSSWVEKSFPQKLLKKYKRGIYNHILRKEIIATQLANDMVDIMGITFFNRMMESTGESASAIAMAYVAARDVFQIDHFQEKIKALDYIVPADDQMLLLSSMMRRVCRGTRWFLCNRHHQETLDKTIEVFKDTVNKVITETPAILSVDEKAAWQQRYDKFSDLGLDNELANVMAMPSHLFSGLGISEAVLQSKHSIPDTVDMHHLLGDKLGFYWFAHAVTDVKVESYWQSMARESFINDIDKVLRVMTVELLRLGGKRFQHEETLQLWMQEYPVLLTRWRNIAHELQTNPHTDFAMFSVAMRELTELAEVCRQTTRLNIEW